MAAKEYCLDSGNPRVDLCFKSKESAMQYARSVSRMLGKNVRVVGLAGARRRRRR